MDRPRERFETLEKLAQLESAPATKKAVIGDAARLAETLGETDRALALWRQRIANDGGDLAALDAVIALDHRDPGQVGAPLRRRHVLAGAHYDATSRPREVIRVLERVIDLDPTSSQALREEAGARLAELDDDQAAMDHYAALLALTPDSSVTQEKLRQLAQRSNNYAGYATGVAAGTSPT